MSVAPNDVDQSLLNNTDKVFQTGVERHDSRFHDDTCSKSPLLKSPLLLMSPQETQFLPDYSEPQTPWVETPFVVPQDDVFKLPVVSFPLEKYLNDENSLERCITGMAARGQCLGSSERYTAQQHMAQLYTDGSSPALATDAATTTGFSGSEYIQVDYPDVIRARDLEAIGSPGGSVGAINEVISLESTFASSATPSAASSSSHSSSQSVLEPSHALPPISSRHECLHRQLQEAGLAGLGDGINSLQLYHR
ncbi:hypothetical protein ED733_005207 [Metarhizium rileyi]|uniref:Uncharacterized protein n=1 Tax=Metarhizium rileyi (strain RCEF 4871) TaxID=1649241 RepID=A0A5C6GFJ9_METRR|nr:hypothetical protein ED733_005207 [Metarhizium rileyi]